MTFLTSIGRFGAGSRLRIWQIEDSCLREEDMQVQARPALEVHDLPPVLGFMIHALLTLPGSGHVR